MRKLFAMLLVLCALSGAAAADDFGQSYDRFLDQYAENIKFINANTSRHLLPLDFKGDFDSLGERIYVLSSGALEVEIKLDDMASQIARCQITLTAPSGMTYGDSRHNEFIVSGYHSYALQMAMHDSADLVERYALVEEVEAGLAVGNGAYKTQVGDYRLTCTAQNGVATLLFENELLMVNTIETEAETEDVPSIEIKDQK